MLHFFGQISSQTSNKNCTISPWDSGLLCNEGGHQRPLAQFWVYLKVSKGGTGTKQQHNHMFIPLCHRGVREHKLFL